MTAKIRILSARDQSGHLRPRDLAYLEPRFTDEP